MGIITGRVKRGSEISDRMLEGLKESKDFHAISKIKNHNYAIQRQATTTKQDRHCQKKHSSKLQLQESTCANTVG